MIDPVSAAKDDLPGLVSLTLGIFQDGFEFASTASSGEEMKEHMEHPRYDTAMSKLISSTRMACDLPASWPGDE